MRSNFCGLGKPCKNGPPERASREVSNRIVRRLEAGVAAEARLTTAATELTAASTKLTATESALAATESALTAATLLYARTANRRLRADTNGTEAEAWNVDLLLLTATTTTEATTLTTSEAATSEAATALTAAEATTALIAAEAALAPTLISLVLSLILAAAEVVWSQVRTQEGLRGHSSNRPTGVRRVDRECRENRVRAAKLTGVLRTATTDLGTDLATDGWHDDRHKAKCHCRDEETANENFEHAKPHKDRVKARPLR